MPLNHTSSYRIVYFMSLARTSFYWIVRHSIGFKSYNKSSFRQDIINVPWHVVLNNPEDLEGCVQTWNKLFLQVAEDHAPTKTRKVRGTPTPWMTSEIATLMRDRNYHLKKAKGKKIIFIGNNTVP